MADRYEASRGCDRLDDASLVRAFETLEIAPADFRHREHVRLAFAMLAAAADFGVAALRFRGALRAFADAVGAQAKYHETLTWAYLAVIAERMSETRYPDSFALLAAHPDLLDHRGGAIARHYDVAAITASPIARSVFVLPRRS